MIQSNFLHAYVVVQVENTCTDNVTYKVGSEDSLYSAMKLWQLLVKSISDSLTHYSWNVILFQCIFLLFFFFFCFRCLWQQGMMSLSLGLLYLTLPSLKRSAVTQVHDLSSPEHSRHHKSSFTPSSPCQYLPSSGPRVPRVPLHQAHQCRVRLLQGWEVCQAGGEKQTDAHISMGVWRPGVHVDS